MDPNNSVTKRLWCTIVSTDSVYRQQRTGSACIVCKLHKGPLHVLHIIFHWNIRIIVLGFNDMSTLVGHFVSSPREREKREEIVKEMKKRDRGERGK